MPSLHVTIFCVYITVAMVTRSVWARSGGQGRCAWWEYHDVIMDNCGPCREICDHMEQTRTQALCQTQCADYLVSQSCGKDEYFDEIMKSCAPCQELCNQRDAKGTSRQCAQKCPEYLDSNPPGNSLAEPFNTDLDHSSSSSSSSSSFSTWLSPIVATVCIGVIAVASIFGTLVLYRRHSPRAGNDVNQNGRCGRGNDGTRERLMQSIPMGVPVQVSSQAMSEDVEVGQRRSTDCVPVLQQGFGDSLAVGGLNTGGCGHTFCDRQGGGFGDSLGGLNTGGCRHIFYDRRREVLDDSLEIGGDVGETTLGDCLDNVGGGLQAGAYGHAFGDCDGGDASFDDTLSDGGDLNAVDFGDSLTDSDIADTLGNSDLGDNLSDIGDLQGNRFSDTLSDNIMLQNTRFGGSGEGERERDHIEPKTPLVGFAECDPHAPSSSAFWHVQR